MSIKNYLQKKKDPEAYLQKRSHEILRELEDILGNIAPKIDKALNEVETFKEEKNEEIAETNAVFTKLKDDLYGEVEPRMKEMRKICDDSKTELGKEIESFIQRQKELLNRIDTKIAEVKLMRGPQGEKGNDGIGIKGDKGDDGSPDTAIQIAEKVNNETQIIEMSVIKGLLKTIEELKRAIRQKEKGGGGGGGGLGAVQHETTNVSSATTQFTTTYKIAGNGYAIMGAYYQSALIMRGEHYTVGGDRKTLTLLFTPQDSTKIDIIYVRG
jgi:hypothetical protein